MLLSSDGNLKVLDLFGVSFLEDLLRDPRAFARSMPVGKWAYILDIPDLQLDDHPADYIRRIESALEMAKAALNRR